MTPFYNSLAATYAAQAETLALLDTEGIYECLTAGCCNLTDTQLVTYLQIINGILIQYAVTQVLPTWEDACCNPICGSFAGGTPVSLISPTFTDLTVSDDLAVAGDFTRGGVAQPIYRSGTGTLAAGTATVTAAWVTANTVIVVSYNTASAAGQANISLGTITPGVNFVVNGEGTNTFSWIAIQNP